MQAVYFDMDGTITDLYGVDGWLESLHNEDVTPYEVAKPLCKEMLILKSILTTLRSFGITVGVISWSAINGSKSYNSKVRQAKKEWLNKYFGNVFNEIHVVKYGTNKSRIAKIKDSILFDDNADVRAAWHGNAYDEKNIVNVLCGVIAQLKSKGMKKKNCEEDSSVPSANGHYAYIDKISLADLSIITKVGKASNLRNRRNQQASYRYIGMAKTSDVKIKYYFECKSDEDALAMENVLRGAMMMVCPYKFKLNDRLLYWDDEIVEEIINHPDVQRWAKILCI